VTNPALDGTHSVRHFRLDSHANYPTSGNNINTVFLTPPVFFRVSWFEGKRP